jgi:hypothetical protein
VNIDCNYSFFLVMMKNFIGALLLVSSFPVFSQSIDVFSKYLPKGWVQVVRVNGDLNADGIPDAVLVYDKPSASPKPKALPPRRMVVVVSTPMGFKKIFSRDNLLPSPFQPQYPCWSDPLRVQNAVSIDSGILTLAFQMVMSCDGQETSIERFKFQIEDSRFRLIAYERSDTSQLTGEVMELIFDYLKGTRKELQGKNLFDESSQAKMTQEPISLESAYYMDNISLDCDPFDPMETEGWCQ